MQKEFCLISMLYYKMFCYTIDEKIIDFKINGAS